MTTTVPSVDDAPPAAGAVPVPPPPPPPMSPLARFVGAHPLAPLTLFAGSGALLFLLGNIGGIAYPALARCLGMFLMLYAAIAGLSLLPSNPFGRRIDAMLEQWLRSGSTGYYGLMALAMFFDLEARDLFSDATAFDFTRGQLWSMFMAWVIGFSIDSVMNTIWATLWPWMLIKSNGPHAVAAMAAIGWGVYWVGARMFPHLHGRLERRVKRKRRKAAAGA